MNDLLALILVGLVLVTAVVSIFTTLIVPSKPCSKTGDLRTDDSIEADMLKQSAQPARRYADRRTAAPDQASRQSSIPTRASIPDRKQKVADA